MGVDAEPVRSGPVLLERPRAWTSPSLADAEPGAEAIGSVLLFATRMGTMLTGCDGVE
jgi:hypothetical protein